MAQCELLQAANRMTRNLGLPDISCGALSTGDCQGVEGPKPDEQRCIPPVCGLIPGALPRDVESQPPQPRVAAFRARQLITQMGRRPLGPTG